MSNLRVMDYPEHDLRIESELQSIPIRIYTMEGTQIGVALVTGATVGEAVIKLLYIDSTERHRIKDIYKCMLDLSTEWGFTKRTHQRKKDGEFYTVTKDVECIED